MNFMFSWQEQYLTSELCSLVSYCSCPSNIKFISSRHRVISSIFTREEIIVVYGYIINRAFVTSDWLFSKCRILKFQTFSSILQGRVLLPYLDTARSTVRPLKILKWNGLVFHWCLYNKQNIIAVLTRGMSSWTREHKIHVHKRARNILFIIIYLTNRDK